MFHRIARTLALFLAVAGGDGLEAQSFSLTNVTLPYGATVSMQATFTVGTAVIRNQTGATLFPSVLSTAVYTTPPLAGSSSFTLDVLNLAGKHTLISNSVGITPIAVAAIRPASPSTPAGSTVLFVSSASGGVNNALAWTCTGGTIDADLGTWVAPGTTGTYTITATSVADSSKTVSTVVTVVPVPVVTSLVATPSSPAFGATFTLTATYSGGAGVISYPGGTVTCPASGVASAPITASTSGARSYLLTVTSAAGAIAANISGVATVTVPSVTMTALPSPKSTH